MTVSAQPLLFRPRASCQDASVNYVAPADDGGYWEARYVQREPSYWICYLSSHTGCNKSCRFCHLTATKQTTMQPADLATYLRQADSVFATYCERRAAGMAAAERVHFNFMARGEPLANPVVLQDSSSLFEGLAERAMAVTLDPKFKVSSIIPREFDADLTQVLADERAQLYYSLYSLDPKFRKRWLPKAMPGEAALDLIADYQRRTGRSIVLHWAFIAGENDSEASVDAVLDAVLSRGITAKFNLVRYNPHDGRHGVEPSEAHLQGLFARIQSALKQPGSRIVPRVGYDVQASCGMFIEPAASTAQ